MLGAPLPEPDIIPPIVCAPKDIRDPFSVAIMVLGVKVLLLLVKAEMGSKLVATCGSEGVTTD